MAARKFVNSMAWNAFGQLVMPMPTADFILDTDLPATTILSTGSYSNPSWITALDAAKLTGTVPTASLPAIAINDIFTVASQAAMLALTAEKGDMAIRTDNGTTYVLSTNSPGTLADWKAITVPGAGVTSWNGLTGAVSATTTNLPEGTNLYYTDARADARVAAVVAAYLPLAGGTLTGGVTFTNFTHGSGAEGYAENGRAGVGIPVPYYTPTQTNQVIALDVFPKGTPADFNTITGVAWIDICSTDIIADGTNYEALRLGKHVGGVAHIGCAKGGTGVVRDLLLQRNGGNVGIGPDDTPNAKLHVNDAVAGFVSILVTNTLTGANAAQVSLQNANRFYSLRIDTDDKFKIRDGTAGVDRLTIDTAGNATFASWVSTSGYAITAPVSARNFNAVGSTLGNSQILLVESGSSGNDVRKISYLLRNTAGSDWQTITYMDGIDVDNVWSAPASLRSWIKRNPLLGQVSLGDGGIEMFRTDPTNGAYHVYTGSLSTLTLWGTGGRAAEMGLVDARSTPFARYIRVQNPNIEFVNATYSLVSHSFGNTGDIGWAGSATGGGSGITGLNASNLASGTVADARLSANLQSLSAGSGISGSVPILSTSGGPISWGTPVQENITALHASGQQPFRLTLETGVSVSQTDQTAKSTLYLTRYRGGLLQIPDSGSPATLVRNIALTTDLSLTLTGLTTGKNYDVFLWPNGATPALELGPAWTNDTTRAAAGLLTWATNGFLCKTGDPSRVWVGTIRTTGTTTTEDSVLKRFVWNAWNPVRRQLLVRDSAVSWNYTTATWRQANANAANKVEYVCGAAEHTLEAEVHVNWSSTTNIFAAAGIGIDSTSVNSAQLFGQVNGTAGGWGDGHAVYKGLPGIGYHSINWLEWSTATGTTSWYSNPVGWINDHAGLLVTLMG